MPKIITPGVITPRYWKGECPRCHSVCIYDDRDVGRYIHSMTKQGLATCPTCGGNVWGKPYKHDAPKESAPESLPCSVLEKFLRLLWNGCVKGGK